MATYSSILAWKISQTQEPGGLQSTGSQRVRLNNITFQSLFQRPSRDITLWLRNLDCPPCTHRVKCNPSTWPSRMFTTSIIVLPHLYSYCSRNIPWSDQDISCLLGKSCPFALCGPPQGSLGKQFCDSYPIPSLNSNSTYSILCSLTGNRALS